LCCEQIKYTPGAPLPASYTSVPISFAHNSAAHDFNLLLLAGRQCNNAFDKNKLDFGFCNIAFDKSKHDFSNCNIALRKANMKNLKTNMKNLKTIMKKHKTILLSSISLLLLIKSLLLL